MNAVRYILLASAFAVVFAFIGLAVVGNYLVAYVLTVVCVCQILLLVALGPPDGWRRSGERGRDEN